MFRLAGFLKMTVAELERRMSSQELSEWIAYTRYFQAIPDPWAETGLVVSAILSPYCEKGTAPKASDFNPIDTPPQHNDQAREVLLDLRKQLGFDD